ncbi:MAG: glycosyltransferase [Planctomycetota bacterium]|nr:glycosyltransferase [Planctomycetota bacterium]
MNAPAPRQVWYALPVLERGGAERVVANLARRMPALGWTPAVCALERENAPVGKELAAAGVEVFGLRRHRRNTLACARDLAERLALRQPEVVHAHLFHANLAARLAARMLKGRAGAYRPRILSTVHVQERRFRPWQFALDRATARWCEKEVCVGPSVERFQRAKTGLPAGFFRVIENGIDLARYPARTPSLRLAARARLDLDDATWLVLAIGRLDPQKDHAALLEAWRRAAPANAELWIAGEGPERARLEARLPPYARLIGFREDVPDLLAACDLFVQPSAWEGQPLTVLEAMAMGCPILASRIPAHEDLLSDGKTGVLVPPGDPGLWSQALTAWLSREADRAALGSAAWAEAHLRFSADRMAREHAALYEECLGKDEVRSMKYEV